MTSDAEVKVPTGGELTRFQAVGPEACYRQTAARVGATSAGLAVARKLLERSCHTLRELGEEALAPA